MALWQPTDLDGQIRNLVFLGEAGCGKSELSINLALALLENGGRPVHFYDLDMTKPLFRSRDQAQPLSRLGLQFHFEEQFMDAPTVSGGVNRLLRDGSCYTILDVGGDYIGARSIGGYAPLLNQPSTAVFYVINPYRPWSATLEHIDKVLGETLGVSHIRLDQVRLVGNPNLGPATTAQDVLAGAETLTRLVGPYKPVDLYCALESLAGELEGRLPAPLFPIRPYLTYPWEQAE